MDIVKVFGTNVRRYRNEKGISQEKLAELSGLQRTLSRKPERIPSGLRGKHHTVMIIIPWHMGRQRMRRIVMPAHR